MPPMEFFLQGIGIDLIYSFVIIVASLMIYYSTKEMYELSSYKGIKYFRYAFLFFAIAYFFKSFIKILLVYFGVSRIIDINPGIIGLITLFVFMYFSCLAVFYLVYSLMWKKLNGDPWIILSLHLLSALVCLVIAITRNIWVLLGVNLFVLAIAIFGIFIANEKSKVRKNKNNLYAIYTLLFVFWILNIIEVLIPSFLQFYQILVYLASLGIFLTILYKVLRRSGTN
jgi:hypothetical protein